LGICARGFRRTSWLRHLLELRQAFVVRLIPDVLIYHGSSAGPPLRDWQLPPGQREPWWLATDLAAPLVEFVALDDRRMAIEAQFREAKGCRLGVRLEWTQFRTPAYLAHFTRLDGAALVLWTAVGQAAAETAPKVRLPCKRKGPRLSLLRVGIQLVATLALRVYIGVHFIQTHMPRPRLRRFPWLQALEAVP
jgi:hypothetical protein